MKTVERFLREEDGQGLVEYGLILALVAVGLIAALGELGDGIVVFFQDAGTTISNLDLF